MDIEERREKGRIRTRAWRSKNTRKKYPHKEWSTEAKEALRVRQRTWRHENVDKTNASARRWRQSTRTKALDALGRVCAHCGFSNPLALELDHIEPLHGQPREPQVRVAKLILQGSKDYQILCANCNTIKQMEFQLHPEMSSGLPSRLPSAPLPVS